MAGKKAAGKAREPFMPPALLSNKWGPANPPPKSKGRPKVPTDIKAAFRELTPLAIETLKNVMVASKDDNARSRAAGVVLDRAWGKATVFLEGELRFGRLSDDDRKAKVNELLTKVQARVEAGGQVKQLEAEILGPEERDIVKVALPREAEERAARAVVSAVARAVADGQLDEPEEGPDD